MSVDEQSAPIKTRSLCARKEKRKKEKGKRIHKKEFPDNVCCLPNRRLRSTRSKTSALRCKTGIPAAAGPYHKAQVLPLASADLHVVQPHNPQRSKRVF
jgi:hypothetical protein